MKKDSCSHPDDGMPVGTGPGERFLPGTLLRVSRVILLLGLVVGGSVGVRAQWTSQSFFLSQGWNAVYLEIEPEPLACDDIFAGRPVDSVWRWNKRFEPVQFIQDASELLPGDLDWMVWFPESSPARSARNLHTMQGGHTYLIKVSDAASPFLWVVPGRPVARPIDWQTDSLNLVGFSVNSLGPPSFSSFFADDPTLSGQPIFRLDLSGEWQPVANPATTQMLPGEAFWIRAEGSSDFKGNLVVETDQPRGLSYGRSVPELTLRIRNESALPKTVTIRQLPSALPPAGVKPLYAGEVPLSYFEIDLAAEQYGWKPLQAFLSLPSIAPGEERALRVSVRRGDMNDFTPPSGETDVLYQSLLEITDTVGSRAVVPVTSRGLQTFVASNSANSGDGSAPHPRAGLWVGNAILGEVNQPAHPTQPSVPVKTATAFQFRLIVHVDASGQPRLLQKVLQMWKEGTTIPDPGDPQREIVDVPGRYVLLTDEALINSFTGATLRDGDPVGRRISSAAFAFREPLIMTGAGEFGENTVTCDVSLDYDDPLNPFTHRYHPDHDSLDERFEQPLPEGVESFSVVRSIELEFSSTDPEGLPVAGWQDNQLGGVYRESITGIHRDTLHLEGVFRLHHVSPVNRLNDEMSTP